MLLCRCTEAARILVRSTSEQDEILNKMKGGMVGRLDTHNVIRITIVLHLSLIDYVKESPFVAVYTV